MKLRFSFLIVLLLVLPLVLAACGGSDTDTAKKFVEAIADADDDEAGKHVCDKNKDKLLDGPGEEDSSFDIKDLKCEEDGDDVTCKFESDLNLLPEAADIEMTFSMDDGKVCEMTTMKFNGEEVPVP